VSDTRPANKGKKRSSLIALAASVVVMVTVSIVAITRPTYNDAESLVDASDENAQPTRGLASIRARTGNHRKIIEERMKSEAEQEFNKMLSDWRKQKK
jgi:hypothetical protein